MLQPHIPSRISRSRFPGPAVALDWPAKSLAVAVIADRTTYDVGHSCRPYVWNSRGQNEHLLI